MAFPAANPSWLTDASCPGLGLVDWEILDGAGNPMGYAFCDVLKGLARTSRTDH